jgi:hypothetical protein
VYDVKRDAEANFLRCKARVVVKGFAQKFGVDYVDVYAPASNPTTTRVFLANVAAERMCLRQVDVKTAFLNGELEETIYVLPPPGLGIPEGKVCRLKKALYGLKQASRAWHQVLRTKLEGLGFLVSSADPTLYVRYKRSGVVYVQVHVDDFLIAGHNDSEVDGVLNALRAEFELRQMESASYFLGVELAYDREKGEMKMSQQRYANEVLARFQMADAEPKPTPLPHGAMLRRAEDGEEVFADSRKYRELVGSLMYLAVYTRPDLAQAVYQLARYMSAPTAQHWEYGKHVLRYLKGTVGYGIVYGGGDLSFRAYSDADWAGDRDSRRSTTGYVFMLNGGAVSWRSRLQHTVAVSSMEAEYQASADAAREAMWLSELQSVFSGKREPVHIWGDNQGALSIIKDHIRSERSKHIDILHNYVRERVERGELSYTYCSTDGMVADMLTKQLPVAKFVQFRSEMGVC